MYYFKDIDERNRLSVRNFPRRRSSTVSGVSGFQVYNLKSHPDLSNFTSRDGCVLFFVRLSIVNDSFRFFQSFKINRIVRSIKYC